MARASSGVSHAQLSWASAWCLRSETYANALARIIDAHHALPVASVWGSTSRTSSDGQFFASGRRTLNPGKINSEIRDVEHRIRASRSEQPFLSGRERLVPFQRDRGHRRRGAVRARTDWWATPPSSTPSCTMSIPAACPTTSSPCSTCSVSRLKHERLRDLSGPSAIAQCFGRPLAVEGTRPPVWAEPINAARSCSSIGTTLCPR